MNDFGKVKRERIYKHTMLNQQDADRLRPLMESAFAEEIAGYEHGNRQHIAQERMRFASEQYANRCRVAKNMGTTPLNEDANIFGEAFPQLKNLFESVSTPGNIIGMGEVANPMEGNRVQGGMWNPGYKPGSGDIPSYVFGLQSQIALHCIGFDLMPTIAVDTPKVVVSYVDTVYGGGTFDDADNLPSFVEISANIFKRSWIKGRGMKRAVTKVLIADKDGNAVELLFILGSTIKAAITAEVVSTGTYDGTTYTPTNEKTVKAIIDAINAEAGAKVYVAADGTTYTAGEDLSGVGVDYASATRTNIAEAASNDNSLGGMSRAQHEKGPKHKLNVIMMDKQLEMVGLEIEADTSNIQIKDMAAAGINVIAHLYSGVQNQLVQSLDEVILDHLYKLGATHAANVYESQGINYSLYIGKPSNNDKAMVDVDVDFKDMLGTDIRDRMGAIPNALVSAAYENQMTHGERLYSRILVILEFVAYQNRIGAPDFIVASGELCSCLKKQSTFSVCPVATTLSQNPELHYSGTIFETVSVYKNPKIDFNDPRILFGRRGNDTDPGAKFLAYDLAASRQTIAEQTMAEKIRVWSRFAIADIGFYPELNYYVAVFLNEYQWV
jgi:hypothetical protein